MAHRILLADDSLTIQKVVELSFADSDFELMAVGSGDKAVAALEEFRPDLVLADVVMPGKSGYEVCEAVKARPGGATTPVVLLTGTFEPFDRARAERAGCDSIVTKPFDSHALVSLVGDLIQKAEKVREELLAAPPPPPPAPPVEEMPFEMEMEDLDPDRERKGADALEPPPAPAEAALEAPAPVPPPPPPPPPPLSLAGMVTEEPGYSTVALSIPSSADLEAMARAVAAGREPGEGLAWPLPPPVREAARLEEPAAPAAPVEVPALEEPAVVPFPEPPAALEAELAEESAPPVSPEPAGTEDAAPTLFELELPEEPGEEPPGEPAPAPVLAEEAPAAEPADFESFLEPPSEPAAAAPFEEAAPPESEAVPFVLEESPVPAVPAPEVPAFVAVAFEEPVPPLEGLLTAPAVPEERPFLDGDETEPMQGRPFLSVPASPPPVPAVLAVPAAEPEAPVEAQMETPVEEDVFGQEAEPPAEEEGLPISSGEIPPPPPPFDAPALEAEDEVIEPQTRDIERDMEAFEKSGSWSSRPEVWEQAEAMGVEGVPDYLATVDDRGAAPRPHAVEESANLATAPFEVPDEVTEPPVELEALAAEARLTDLSKLIPSMPQSVPVAAVSAVPLAAGASVSDADVERIARRVAELIGERVIREIAWDVVPELAERLVRERIREIES